MRHKQAWTMPAEEARTFLQQIQEKIASSDIEVPHRDVLIRLRSIIEEDLEAEFERSVGSCQEDRPPRKASRALDLGGGGSPPASTDTDPGRDRRALCGGTA